jgi:hypothetical protein
VLLAGFERIRSYTIVDLPEILAHAAFTVDRHLPDLELVFDEPGGREGTVTLVADAQAGELVSDASASVLLNFNSFMEMDRGARDGYIELIYRAARPGALFFNVNRRQPALPLADGGTWDNNPLLYPYRPTDRVLFWDQDPFQAATRNRFGTVPNLAVARAALI